MASLICGGCYEEVIGRMIAIDDVIEPKTFDSVGVKTRAPGGEIHSVLPLHPICFLGVFNQMMQQETESVIEVYITTSQNFKEALDME